MKIFSGAGVILPGLGPPTDDPPTMVTGTPLGLVQEFGLFATFVDTAAKALKAKVVVALTAGPAATRINLPEAMHTYFIKPVVDELKLDSSMSLYTAIANVYDKLGALADKTSQFYFSLYFFITLFHFEVWYCHEQAYAGTINDPLLPSGMQTYVKKILKTTYFHDGIKVSEAFYQSIELQRAFFLDRSLMYMLGLREDPQQVTVDVVLNELTRLFAGKYVYLRGAGGGAALGAEAAAIVKRKFLQTLRTTVREILDADIGRFLAALREKSAKLADSYGNFQQYALGDGTSTTSMFGKYNFGLIFSEYELDDLENPVKVCKPYKNNISLIDASDPAGTSATFLYYGLDFDFRTVTKGTPAALLPPPTIQLNGFSGTTPVAVARPVRNASDLWDHRPLDDAGAIDDSVGLGDGVTRLTSLQCNINSALGYKQDPKEPDNWEEMIYIIFKHNIPDPRRPQTSQTQTTTTTTTTPGSIFLSAEWTHLDNDYQKVLVPRVGQTPAVIEPATFDQPQSELAALAAILVANPNFMIDVVITGFGIGFYTGAADKKAHKLIKSPNQADRPNAPGYGQLRHAHGWLEWEGPGTTGSGWLIGQVGGFASPLRCTWEDHFAPTKKQILDTFLKDLVTEDAAGRPVYNCVLSSIRAFSLFHAMIEALCKAVDATGASNAAAVKQKLQAYLKNEAQVDVILPTGVKMGGGPLKYHNIEPFY